MSVRLFGLIVSRQAGCTAELRTYLVIKVVLKVVFKTFLLVKKYFQLKFPSNSQILNSRFARSLEMLSFKITHSE